MTADFRRAAHLYELATGRLEAGLAGDALPACREAIEILQSDGGEYSAEMARWLGTLGTIQEQLGDHDAAAAAYSRSAEVVRQIEFEDAFVELHLHTMSSLARLHRIRGEYDAAEREYLAAIAVAKSAFDDDDTKFPDLIRDLATTYRLAGRIAEADVQGRRALRAYETAGTDSPEVAAVSAELGDIARTRGQFAEAERFVERARAIRLAADGPDSETVARDTAALAAVVHGQGRFERAETLYREALAGLEKTLGREHYEVGVTLNNLAALQATRGEYETAERTYRRAITIKEKVFGGEHADVALTVHNLGVLQIQRGKTAAALVHVQRALGIFETALGVDHPRTIACRRVHQSLLEAADEAMLLPSE